MASEIHWVHTASGETVYVTIRSAARTYWYTVTPELEALSMAHWADYDIALTETPASSYFYVGTWPAALSTVGFYWVDVFKQAGAGPVRAVDTLLGTLIGYWNGTALLPWAADTQQVSGTAQTAEDLLGVWTPTKAGYLDAAITTRHLSGAAVAKSPATLAAADVSGNLPADLQTIKTQAVTAAAPVTIPATLATDAGSAAATVTALWAKLVDGTITYGQFQAVMLGMLAGLTTGGGTATLKFLGQDDATERVTFGLDANRNRLTVTFDFSDL